MATMTAPTPKTNGSVQAKTNGIAPKTTSFQVLMTTNYDLFHLMPNNRNLNLLHIKRLSESFKEKHLVVPIIVNEKHEIIDGQHRYHACKELGLPIYYLVIPGYGICDVQILNTNQKNWTKIDYLHSYVAAAKRPYLEFKKFMEDFPELSFQACERILTGLSAGKKQGVLLGKKANMKDFEEGKLVIPDLSKSYSIARKIMDIKPYYENFGRGIFATVMMSLLKSKNYNHKEMLHKLSVAPIKLQDCLNVEAYKMLLEDIYNHKRQKENKVSFRYE
jgi:hypothetical protein